MIRVTTVAFALLVALALLPAGAAAQGASLKNPASLKEQAPATYKVKFDTSAGVFVIQVNRVWAPLGADRFYNLVKSGFYDDARFFRAISGFMVQFGINGDPAVSAAWRNARIGVDPVKQSNKPMFITYAMGGSPDTRTTQVFINYGNNANLDSMASRHSARSSRARTSSASSTPATVKVRRAARVPTRDGRKPKATPT